jgi:hypothetical protein
MFWNLWTIYIFNLPIFFQAAVNWITETTDTESAHMGAWLYLHTVCCILSLTMSHALQNIQGFGQEIFSKLESVYFFYSNPVYSVQYYPQFHVTAVCLRMYYPCIWRPYCNLFCCTISLTLWCRYFLLNFSTPCI